MVIALTLIAVLLAAGVGLIFYSGTQRAAAQAARPNVVVIMSDDQDMDSLPVMRNLLSRPQGSWVTFPNAFANTSICTPSRGTLLTGQYAHHHGAVGNNWGEALDDNNTLAVWMDNAGYRTALIGKYLHSYEDLEIGDGTNLVPGWDYFLKVEPGVSSVDTHVTMAADFITADDGPFFLWLASEAPHIPATPPNRYLTANAYVPPDRPNFNEADVSDKPPHVRREPLLSATEIAALRAERLNSQRELLAIDDGIQTIIDTLDASGKLDNTLVIFVGDNGFSWGSHREYEKLSPYDEASRVPLFIRYPGAAGNRTETRYVSNVDLASTILDYAGVAPGAPQDGRSLLPLLRNQAVAWNQDVLLEKAYGTVGYYAVRAPGWVYIEYATGDKELYDMSADPFQLQNLAGRSAYAAIQADLAGRLDALLNEDPDTTPTPTRTPTPTATPTRTPTPTATPNGPGSGTLYLGSSVPGTAGGVTYADEDILAYDLAAGTWSLYFDGSDVGLSAADVDAFAARPDGSLLLSLDAALNVPGLGQVDDSDVLRFAPTSLGNATAGTFQMALDGSDVGLTTAAEDVDAVGLLPGGDLLISTRGKATVGAVAAMDEDLLRFSPSPLGPNTAGTWALYFDGSDVALAASGEDLTGVSYNDSDGHLYLNTLGAFKVTGLAGERSDIFICRPLSLGPATSCDFAPGFFWRGMERGAGNIPLDSFAVLE